MKLIQQLARAELIALLSLAAVALVVAGCSALFATAYPGMFTPLGSAQLSFIGTLYIGVLPVALLGAPLYVLLSYRRQPAWPVVLLLGALPALVVFLDTEVGILGLSCGLAIASLTHVFCKRWVNPK